MSGSRVIGGILISLLLTGCLPVLHPWATDRAVDGSYDQVFQATLEVLEARDFPIDKADWEAGRIQTGKRPVTAVAPLHPVETVRVEIERGDEEISIRLFMTVFQRPPSESPPGSRRAEDRSGDALDSALNRRAIYDEYLDAIEDRVAEYRSPSASNGEEGTKGTE